MTFYTCGHILSLICFFANRHALVWEGGASHLHGQGYCEAACSCECVLLLVTHTHTHTHMQGAGGANIARTHLTTWVTEHPYKPNTEKLCWVQS